MNVICETCGNSFNKFPNQIKKTNHHYCSNRCSNIKSNKNRWKHHLTLKEKYKCIKCGLPRDYRTKYDLCLNCITTKYKNMKLGELKIKYKNKPNGRWYSSEIRSFNRSWNSNLINLPCQKCEYKTHTELCHIKSIDQFDDSSTIGEINNPLNIIVLCPNHHWEFDNNFIKLSDIAPRK